MKFTGVLLIAVLIVQVNLVKSQNRTSIARVFESFWNIFDPSQPATGNPITAGVNRLDEFTKQAVDYGIVTFTRVLSPFLQRLEQNASGNTAAPAKPNETTTTTTEEPRSRRDAGLFEEIVQSLEPSDEILSKSANLTSDLSETATTPGSSSKWAMRIRNYRRSAASSAASKTNGSSAHRAPAESWIMATLVVVGLTVTTTRWILAAKKC